MQDVLIKQGERGEFGVFYGGVEISQKNYILEAFIFALGFTSGKGDGKVIWEGGKVEWKNIFVLPSDVKFLQMEAYREGQDMSSFSSALQS